jgi:hypothetical protein
MFSLPALFSASLKQLKYRDFAVAGFLFIFALVYYYISCISSGALMAPNSYQARDLTRAVDLYFNNGFIWHGPEVTSGGFLPGPFYYILLGLPYYLTQSLLSFYWFEYVLVSCGLVLTWIFLKRNYSLTTANLFYFIFLSSPYFKVELLSFMNPAFQYFFLLAAICCFLGNEKNRHYILGGLALGLTFQLHYAALTLLFSVILALLSDRQMIWKNKVKAIFLIGASTAIPCLFYFVRVSLFAGNDPYFSSTNAFFNILHTTGRAFDAITLESGVKFFNLFLNEFYILPAIFLLLLNWKSKTFERRLLMFTMVFSGIFLGGVAVSFVTARYVAPFVLASAFWFSISVGQIKDMKYRFAFILFSAVFISVNFAELWPKHLRQNVIVGWQTLSASEALTKNIIMNTGWEPKYFHDHSYFYGLYTNDSYNFIYSYFYSKSAPQNLQKYDGMWALPSGLYSPAMPEGPKYGKLIEFLPVNIYSAMMTGDIECKKWESTKEFQLCYYNFKSKEKIRRWGNLGSSYSYSEKPPPGNYGIKPGVSVLAENEAVIYDNQCGYQHPDCYIYFDIKIFSSSVLKLEITGAPLAGYDPWEFPRWSRGFKSSRLVVNCSDRTSEFLITNMGFGDDRSNFSPPFDEYFELPCQNPKSVSVVIGRTIDFLVLNTSGRPIQFSNFSGTWERHP